jgi:UDP-glucose 4-epimerase
MSSISLISHLTDKNPTDINILVTGGCGFVGSYLVKWLLGKKYHVFVLDDLSTTIDSHPAKQYFNSNPNETVYIPSTNYTIIKGSTLDIGTSLFTIFDNTHLDLVFHFGEFSRINASWIEIDKVMNSNLLGTTKVLELCKQKNAKLVYSASSAILGEELPATPYTFTKKCMVELIKCYHKWYNLDYIITYFYNVYGENQISEGKYATVIGIFEKQYLQNKPLTVVLPGTQKRIFTHIEDIISGITIAIENFINKDVPIASHDSISILDLAHLFYSTTQTNNKSDNPNIIYLPEQVGNRPQSIHCLKDILREIGWETKHSLYEYIKRIKETNKGT